MPKIENEFSKKDRKTIKRIKKNEIFTYSFSKKRLKLLLNFFKIKIIRFKYINNKIITPIIPQERKAYNRALEIEYLTNNLSP